MIPIVVLAAGASRRMRGRDKLLEEVDGAPVLRVMAKRALTVSDRVYVTLPVPPGPRAAALDGPPVELVLVPEADTGMSASLRRAVTAMPTEATGMIVLPADMPDLSASDLAAVRSSAEADPTRVVRGSAGITPGHPTYLPRRLFPTLSRLRGDTGARAVLQSEETVLVPLPARHALTDLDTPEDWESWRAQRR